MQPGQSPKLTSQSHTNFSPHISSGSLLSWSRKPMTSEQTLKKNYSQYDDILKGLFIYYNLITEIQMYWYNKEKEKSHDESLQKGNRPHVKANHQIHFIQLRYMLSKEKKKKTKWVQWNHDLPIRNFFTLNLKLSVQRAVRISTGKIFQVSTIWWK